MPTRVPPLATREEFHAASATCDIVMKGGVTSGIVYPRAITSFARDYQFRHVGGASAGAIGAAMAAAAEYGRYSPEGGFTMLDKLPDQLKGGGLLAKFKPQESTRGLYELFLAAVGPKRTPLGWATTVIHALPTARRGAVPGLIAGVVSLALLTAFIRIGASGVAGYTAMSGWIALGVVLVVLSAVAVLVGLAVAAVLDAIRVVRDELPQNQFGLCNGIAPWPAADTDLDEKDEQLTDWLSRTLNELAGLDPYGPPLTFGQLRAAPAKPRARDKAPREIELRMIASCLTQARPYEFPTDSKNFFFDPDVWSTLFPRQVVDALTAASPSSRLGKPPAGATPRSTFHNWRVDRQNREALKLNLYRLPFQSELPVIVAVRMSLSFPALFSAIPLWSYPDGLPKGMPTKVSAANRARYPFRQVWFMDGGLCSNFPLHLFENPLPTRPTFAINLGRFDDDDAESELAAKDGDLVFARSIDDGAQRSYRDIPSEGFPAIVSFASAIFDTMRNWQDNSYTIMPGYRDRIIKVLQTSKQGGLNLNMGEGDIETLVGRGARAGSILRDRFRNPDDEFPSVTGWRMHQWIRYRAALAALPDYLGGYAAGRDEIPAGLRARPPFYKFKPRSEQLATELDAAMAEANAAVTRNAAGRGNLLSVPNPPSKLRRVTQF